jgi:ribosomal protein L37AE/L43A
MAEITNDNFINLEKVNCPNCGQEQPIIRIPSGIEETLWGGWTCEKCGTKIDRHGKEKIES